jgi:hypothetical protein
MSIQIVDVYIYGDYEILGKDRHPVLQKRDGSRIAEITGMPDISQIICDVMETRTGKIAICSKLFKLPNYTMLD